MSTRFRIDKAGQCHRIPTKSMRGKRPVHYTITGRDAFGETVTEKATSWVHWRKYKRMMRGMGR